VFFKKSPRDNTPKCARIELKILGMNLHDESWSHLSLSQQTWMARILHSVRRSARVVLFKQLHDRLIPFA
jgi:hypothetical protein